MEHRGPQSLCTNDLHEHGPTASNSITNSRDNGLNARPIVFEIEKTRLELIFQGVHGIEGLVVEELFA